MGMQEIGSVGRAGQELDQALGWARAGSERDRLLLASLWLDRADLALQAMSEGADLATEASWGMGPSSGARLQTALAYGLEWGSIQALMAILDWKARRAPWGAQSIDGKSSLFGRVHESWMLAACERGRLDVCKAMVEAGAPAPKPRMAFDLLDQLMRGRGREVKVKRGQDADRTWKSHCQGRSMAEVVEPCLVWAVGSGMDAKANRGSFDHSSRIHGRTMLMEAGSGAVAKALIDAGADVDALDQGGWSALAHALHSGRNDWIQALMVGGADLFRVVKRPSDGSCQDAQSFAGAAGRPKSCLWALEGARAAIAQAAAPALVGAPASKRVRL